MKRRVCQENAASSPLPGWRSQGTQLGSNAVVKPEPQDVARDWALNGLGGRKPTSADASAWREHAKRSGLSADEAETAWSFLSRASRLHPEHVCSSLRTVFGESMDWAGHWMPNPGMVKMHRAPEIGNARGMAQNANEAPGFPFHTWSAERVWAAAQKLVLERPESNPVEIIDLAVSKSGVLPTELSPEDFQLLRMAVDWLQNGPARTNVRIGAGAGSPGGPLRSTGVKGAP